MQESLTYQAILEEGREEGRQKVFGEVNDRRRLIFSERVLRSS
jgi:predicted transposase YdaD